MKNLENNLDKALDMFINAMRLFISTELKRKYGDEWEKIYFETLNDQQKKNWGSNRDIKNQITSHVFSTYKKPKNYTFLRDLSFFLKKHLLGIFRKFIHKILKLMFYSRLNKNPLA